MGETPAPVRADAVALVRALTDRDGGDAASRPVVVAVAADALEMRLDDADDARRDARRRRRWRRSLASRPSRRIDASPRPPNRISSRRTCASRRSRRYGRRTRAHPAATAAAERSGSKDVVDAADEAGATGEWTPEDVDAVDAARAEAEAEKEATRVRARGAEDVARVESEAEAEAAAAASATARLAAVGIDARARVGRETGTGTISKPAGKTPPPTRTTPNSSTWIDVRMGSRRRPRASLVDRQHPSLVDRQHPSLVDRQHPSHVDRQHPSLVDRQHPPLVSLDALPQIPRVHDFEAVHAGIELHDDFVFPLPQGVSPVICRTNPSTLSDRSDPTSATSPRSISPRFPPDALTFGASMSLLPSTHESGMSSGSRRPHAAQRLLALLVPGLVHAVIQIVQLDHAPRVRVIRAWHRAIFPTRNLLPRLKVKLHPGAPPNQRAPARSPSMSVANLRCARRRPTRPWVRPW